MKKICILAILMTIFFSLFGCRTMTEGGSFAGAGTYPLDSSVDGTETVLATQEADTFGGFEIVRIALLDLPISDLTRAALDLKFNIVDIDDAPVDGETAAPISSNWAYDHAESEDAHSMYATDMALASAVTIDATAFTGNLSTSDTSIQLLANAVDSLDPGTIEDSGPKFQADDPTIDSNTGLYIATSTNHAFYVVYGVYIYNISEGTLIDSDTTAPVIADNGSATTHDGSTSFSFAIAITETYIAGCTLQSDALSVDATNIGLSGETPDYTYTATYTPVESADIDITVSCVDLAGNSTDYATTITYGE